MKKIFEKNKSAVILNPERSEWVSRSYVTGVEIVVNNGAKTKPHHALMRSLRPLACGSRLKMTFSTLTLAAVLSFSIASESRAMPEGCAEVSYSCGPSQNCTSCKAGYELYNGNYGCKWCRVRTICTSNEEKYNGICLEKCPDKYTRNNSGTCIKTTCDSNEEKDNGVCVEKCTTGQVRINGTCTTSRACSNGGGYACLRSNGAEANNCCFKIEGETTTIYPEDPEQEYEVDGYIPMNTNLVIEPGASIISGEFLNMAKSAYLSENTSFTGCWCCTGMDNIEHIIMPDNGISGMTMNCGHLWDIVCLGDIDKCKENIGSSYADRVVAPSESQCNGSGTYYYTGSECKKRPEAGTDITCDHEYSGYVKVGNYCVSPENSYAKKHYTPAEANQWLKDDDNFVVITFKK